MVLWGTISLFFHVGLIFKWLREISDIYRHFRLCGLSCWVTAHSKTKAVTKLINYSYFSNWKRIWYEQINGDIYLLNMIWNYGSCIYSKCQSHWKRFFAQLKILFVCFFLFQRSKMVVVIMTPVSNPFKNTVTLEYGILTATLFGLCVHLKL